MWDAGGHHRDRDRPPSPRPGHRGGHLATHAGTRRGQRPRRRRRRPVTVTSADILALPFDDVGFNVVIAEAVTIFIARPKAASKLARVTRPSGRVLATEFYWRKPPTDEAREVFLGQVCHGMHFDSVEAWMRI